MDYSTYLGGSGIEWSPDKDAGNGIAVDAAGNFYVTGGTNSLGRYDSDVFVRKFDPTGTRLLYETYLDSNGTDDVGTRIAVDAAGNAYITGRFGDAWLQRGLGVLVAKLGPAGAVLYKVTFGADSASGFSGDIGWDIAVDAAGNAYVVGTTFSGWWQPFPTTTGAFQRAYGGGLGDAFVAKLDAHGNFIYSTLLGREGYDRGYGISVDAAGNAYVVGDTDGTFPTTAGAFQRTPGGESDVFVAKLSPTGSALVYSTYVGGTGADEGLAIALDTAGNTYLTGSTVEVPTIPNTFPVVNAFQPAYGGAWANAFVAKLNAAGSALLYSSYMGGTGWDLVDVGYDIAVDSAGYAYLTGVTETRPDIYGGPHFPIVNAFQATHGGGVSDAFVTKLTPQGALVYSSFLGGSGEENGNSIALGAAGNVYIAGSTTSPDFPITVPTFQPDLNGDSDAFVTRIAPKISLALSATTVAGCKTLTGTVTLALPALTGGALIALADSLAAASVPSSITVPAGTKSKSFTVATTPVTSAVNGTITARYGGDSASSSLRVRPIGVAALTLTPNPVVGPAPVTGMVTLECPAAPSAITVNLSSSNTTVAAVPASLVIAAGTASKTFTASTADVTAQRAASLAASANAVAKSVVLTVKP